MHAYCPDHIPTADYSGHMIEGFFTSFCILELLIDVPYRFAILSGPTIPIIGEGDEEANDR